MNKGRLLERLRKTRSTGKTLVIENWPEIKEALCAGFSKKDVFEELQKDGLEISYIQFTRLTKDLLDDDEKHNPPDRSETAHTTVKKDVATPVKQKAQVLPSSPSEAKPTEKSTSGKRFKFDPKPKQDELI